MDNVTHTLAGAAFAELALQLRAWRKPDEKLPALRGATWLASMLASNAPDGDILLSPAIRSPLGYMLHHRGHTHTVLLAPVLGALSVGAAMLWARRRGGLPRAVLPFLGLLATAMVLLHVAMDFGNSYGVHPFWPFESRWHYGDAIFIVEPLLWAVLAIPMALSVRTHVARRTLLGIALLGLALSATVPLVSYFGLLLVGVVSGFTFMIARNFGGLVRPAMAVIGLVIVEATFFGVHVEAEIHARGTMAAAFPRATTLDVVMSPSPANPLCWGVLGIAIEGDDLVMRRFALSLGGSLQHVDGCRLSTPEHTTAVRVPIERISTESVRFFDETRTPLATLRDWAAQSEDTAALLRWSRAPYLLVRDGEPTIAGDVRFDREAALGFSELEVHQGEPLGGWVPAWVPPRLDVIDPTQTPARRVRDVVVE